MSVAEERRRKMERGVMERRQPKHSVREDSPTTASVWKDRQGSLEYFVTNSLLIWIDTARKHKGKENRWPASLLWSNKWTDLETQEENGAVVEPCRVPSSSFSRVLPPTWKIFPPPLTLSKARAIPETHDYSSALLPWTPTTHLLCTPQFLLD